MPPLTENVAVAVFDASPSVNEENLVSRASLAAITDEARLRKGEVFVHA
jgi:hypothetical protein